MDGKVCELRYHLSFITPNMGYSSLQTLRTEGMVHQKLDKRVEPFLRKFIFKKWLRSIY